MRPAWDAVLPATTEISRDIYRPPRVYLATQTNRPRSAGGVRVRSQTSLKPHPQLDKLTSLSHAARDPSSPAELRAGAWHTPTNGAIFPAAALPRPATPPPTPTPTQPPRPVPLLRPGHHQTPELFFQFRSAPNRSPLTQSRCLLSQPSPDVCRVHKTTHGQPPPPPVRQQRGGKLSLVLRAMLTSLV